MPRPTVQQCLRANAAKLIRDERMRAAVRSSDQADYGAWRCEDGSGRQWELVDYWVVSGRAVLSLASDRTGGRRVEDTAGIELGPGSQAYFRCPRCQGRVQDLYLYGSHFWCRRCHGLAYASQQESRPKWLRRTRQEVAAARRERFRQRLEEARGATPEPDWKQQRQEIQRRLEEEMREQARQRRLRHVRHTGRPGRPREKRPYQHDDSRRVKLQPGEAYCCRCRAARPYRYPRRAELLCALDVAKGIEIDRTAIRARCRVCNTPVFRIVRPEEAEGLQDFYG